MAKMFAMNPNGSGLPQILSQGWATDLYNMLGLSDKFSDSDISKELNTAYGLNLTHDEWMALLGTDYAKPSKNLLGQKYQSIDYDRLNTDFNEMKKAVSQLPELPNAEKLLEEARAKAYGERDVALKELNDIYNSRVQGFNDELQSLASGYNSARSGILSSQYQQNAQLMDTLSSQLDKQNRNALEAGASAGLRLAGNINTLLSTQNKQSQLSLDTANQLAQMMVSQRNAEASVRGRYGDYLQQDFSTRQGIRDSAENKAQSYYSSNLDAAENSYNAQMTDFDNKYQYNPFYTYRTSMYNKSGG